LCDSYNRFGLSDSHPSCAALGVDAPDVAAIVPLRESEGACASG
jgi:hypothetical protein